LRYRKHVRELPGRPDIVFPRARVVVFSDGDFWHGRNWPTLRPKLERGTNSGYWAAKIASNIERDRAVNQALAEAGWRVLRLWENEIKRDPCAAVNLVVEALGAPAIRQQDSSSRKVTV
jgi:DNA mismatch endonuclease (patch repair protein)